MCRFRKANSTQHTVFRYLQKLQKELDSRGFIGTNLMALSKPYVLLTPLLIDRKIRRMWSRQMQS